MWTHGPVRWFSYRGRAHGREFILQSAIIMTLSAATDTLGAAAHRADVGGWTPGAAALLIDLLCIGASWAVIFRRLHDFDVRGGVVLIPLLCAGAILGVVAFRTGTEPQPIVYQIVFYISAVLLSSIPGMPSPNRFGPPPGLRAPPTAAAETA